MTSELQLDLEQYVKDRMVPWSLRWDIHPQQGDPDLDSWFRFFNEERISLLNFLTERKKN